MHGEGAERPLASWRFEGSWRRSQQTILDAVGDRIDGADPLHLVAPPGAGKTLLGLELARRRGSRTLVLAPTATIRAQWARAGRDLAPAGRRAEGEADAVSEDPRAPGDLTALTYQMLSVIDATRSPYDELAREEWRRELVDAGRDDQAADAWLSDLAEQNIRTYRTGIRRRGRRLRREAVRADPGLLAQGLHENARELIDRLVEHGVTTVVLDECHHLLDHWALVVHCLLARIRERGGTPLVIGLTATLPSAEDSEEFENYSGLLGDVDYELPTPAVVKEGNLAPYRDLAWFVTPTPDEISFLREHSTRLERLVAETLGTPDGRDFLVGLLQPGPEEDGDEARLAAAFRADATIAEAAARMLALTAPEHPLVSLVGRDARRAPDTEQRLRILARYALERILPDPDRAALWESMRRLLADFGFLLTDRGIRRGRDPIDAVLATTRAKESAIGDILRVELASGDGERVRAAAILDFAVHGHGRQEGAAGALRCFETVAADPDLAELRPVLVTSAHLRIAARDASVLLPRLEDALGVGPLAAEAASATSLEVSVPGVGASRVVEAVSRLVSEGMCRLIVGTRGLLGEGWDCPAVNTLIDLSAVATSSATQQLRGRTLRLDPAWPGKVAHNWTITAVLEPDVGVDGAGDLRRLLRKQDQTWGLLQDGPPAVVRGIAHTLGPDAMRELESLADGDRRASAARISGATVREMIPRAETRERWGIGEPYVGEERPEVVLRRTRGARPILTPLAVEGVLAVLLALLAGAAVGAVRLVGGLLGADQAPWVLAGAMVAVLAIGGFSLRREVRRLVGGLRRIALPARATQSAAVALARVLHDRGEVPRYGRENVVVARIERAGRAPLRHLVRLAGGAPDEQRRVLDAFAELVGPIGSPRFLLEVGAGDVRDEGWAGSLALRVAARLGGGSRFFAVPRDIGRRRADAQAFADEWRREIGSCLLHEIDAPEKLALLTRARRQAASDDEERATRREVWA